MSSEYRLHSELYSFWANDIFKSTVTATEYCSVLTHNKRHEVQLKHSLTQVLPRPASVQSALSAFFYCGNQNSAL